MEREKIEFAIAGPMARITDTLIWARPFTDPNDALLGEDAVMKMNTLPMQPVRKMPQVRYF